MPATITVSIAFRLNVRLRGLSKERCGGGRFVRVSIAFRLNVRLRVVKRA